MIHVDLPSDLRTDNPEFLAILNEALRRLSAAIDALAARVKALES